MGVSCAELVPQKPGQIQIRLRLRAHRQPHQLPLGPESLPRLFRRGEHGAVEAARRDGAGEAVEGPAGCADRCGMSESYLSPTISDCFDPASPLVRLLLFPPIFFFEKIKNCITFHPPAFTIPAPSPTSPNPLKPFPSPRQPSSKPI